MKVDRQRSSGSLRAVLAVSLLWLAQPLAAQETLPEGPLVYGAFEAVFSDEGTFRVEGSGWPTLGGRWAGESGELSLDLEQPPEGCEGTGRYRYEVDGQELRLFLAFDTCRPRRMIFDRSAWRPPDQPAAVPRRRIVVRSSTPKVLPEPATAEGSWPSFRGRGARGVADGQRLPDTWSAESGENILWRADIPGLGHASPIVWGDRIFVATAVSGDPAATFRPGLYGDGDAAADRSEHRFELHALDKRSGATLWTRVAASAVPIDRRHIKSTYANGTPTTDGRLVVAAFGSQGVYAYTVAGEPLWSVDLGRLDLGAYDVPSYEWGPASSPILWNGMVILQCDTQQDSFVVALGAETGELVWKTDRDELPTWGTPTVVEAESGPELVTNGSHFIRGYDPRTGEELWRLGGSSKITAPTPFLADGLIVAASGRAPERPIFVVRPGARGDLTLPEGQSRSDAVAWSIERRGPYMPTPIAYEGRLFVLGNNGIFDAYDLRTGRELYRERLAHGGSGFSGSPVSRFRLRVCGRSRCGRATVGSYSPSHAHRRRRDSARRAFQRRWPAVPERVPLRVP